MMVHGGKMTARLVPPHVPIPCKKKVRLGYYTHLGSYSKHLDYSLPKYEIPGNTNTSIKRKLY